MSRAQLTDLDFANVSRAINMPDPLSGQEPATKAYVDSVRQPNSWKDSVRVASTANINLAAPGATIDAIAMDLNDRFLAKDQTAGAENGIYVWNGATTPATRAADMDSADEVEQATVSVQEGHVQQRQVPAESGQHRARHGPVDLGHRRQWRSGSERDDGGRGAKGHGSRG